MPEEPVDNVITWIYEEGSFVPCAKIAGEEAYNIVADYLGTPTHAFNSKGDKVWERELDCYGSVRKEMGIKGLVPQLYQGQMLDEETGLAYNRFRYYDSDSGNYISQDPIGLWGGIKLYNYVKDTSLYIDQAGLTPETFTASNGVTLEVHNYTEINHMTDKELQALYHANNNAIEGRGFGLSGVDKQGNTIVLHHYKQNPTGPMIAMPQKHHDKPHTNPGQHPNGKKRGGGLTVQERADFNRWKQEYWRNKADTELQRRGIHNNHH